MKKEENYMNKDLTLTNLSKQIDISSNIVSYILNGYIGLNFYDFVNIYRIKKSMKYLSELNKNNMSVNEVALKVGFKSKSTFYKIFKKQTNMTPTKYLNTHE